MVRWPLAPAVLALHFVVPARALDNERVAVAVGSRRLVRERGGQAPSEDEEASSLLEARRGWPWASKKKKEQVRTGGDPKVKPDLDTVLINKKHDYLGHEEETECLKKPKQIFSDLFDNGKLKGYTKGIARTAKHSPSAGKLSLQLSALVLDAWQYFIGPEDRQRQATDARNLKRFKQTLLHYRDDIVLDAKGMNKGFFIHLETCWKVATHMRNAPSLNSAGKEEVSEEVRMHEFAYAFILAFGYTGKIMSAKDFQNSDYLELVQWNNEAPGPTADPFAPKDNFGARFAARETELGYELESDILDKWREAIAKDREVVPWVKASEANPRHRFEVEANTFGQRFQHIKEPMFVDHFLYMNIHLFSNLNDPTYKNEYDNWKVNRWDLEWAKMTKRDTRNQALDKEQHQMYVARAGMSRKEQLEEYERYRQFLRYLFRAGLEMLPARNADASRRRRRDNLHVPDPAFQMLAIVAHEFCFKGIRDGYGRDILMLVPTVQPKNWLTKEELAERGEKPIPPHLLEDQPKPRADDDLDVRNDYEEPAPVLQQRQEGPAEQEAEAVDDATNRALEEHFARLTNQHGSQEKARAAAKSGQGLEGHLPEETPAERRSRLLG